VVQNLNELEYINGEIWANVWTTDNIVRINPETGKIVGEIDLTGLLSPHLINPKIPVDVLNGIAYDNDKQKIYVTGKLWPKIFEIEIIPKKR
jgi:glutaminyl-peptide cyclotransferase